MKKDNNKYIGKHVLQFTVEGCDPKYFSAKTFTRTFEKEGEMGKYIEEMMERGYVFENAWRHEVYWKDFLERHPDFKFWDEEYKDVK